MHFKGYVPKDLTTSDNGMQFRSLIFHRVASLRAADNLRCNRGNRMTDDPLALHHCAVGDASPPQMMIEWGMLHSPAVGKHTPLTCSGGCFGICS